MSEDKFNNDFKSDTLAEDQILLEKILSPLDLRRDLLIEHLHKIQDYFGFLSEKNFFQMIKIYKSTVLIKILCQAKLKNQNLKKI